MTKQEAIKVLNTYDVNFYEYTANEVADAIDMAVESLKDDWVPVSEPPKENGDYIVSLEDAVDTSAMFFNGKWFMSPVDSIAREYGEHEVFAWRPLPKPYKESEE